MKKQLMFSVVLFFAACAWCLNSGCSFGKKDLETKKDKVSYAIGLDIGSNFKRQAIDIDADAFLTGLKDALADSKPLLKDEEVRQVLMEFQNEMREKQMTMKSEMSEKNKKAGEEFLAKNKQNKEVKTTASGLQYKIIKQGTGTAPKASDIVTVDYEGRSIDGVVFDSSYKRGQPATFPVKGVIAGWTEALQLMKPGAKYELYIPSQLAYGENGAGGEIGPNAALIFTVELVSINKN